MTEQELLAQAAAEIRLTTISLTDWLANVFAGRYTPTTVKDTHHFKAHSALEALKSLPSVSLASLAQNVVFTAWDPAAGLTAPPGWHVAFSADPHVGGDTVPPAQHLADARAAALDAHSQGRLVASWGNQNQIGPLQIKNFGDEIGADFLIYQAETAEEFDTAIYVGAQIIIGNPNAWMAVQREVAVAKIAENKLALIFEVYSNQGDPWPDAASSQGVPAASECLGVGWGPNPYQLVDYKLHTPPGVWKTACVYLAEKVTDWSVWP